jgi:1-deoxy-D-xylulose-5-phosphate synthase
MVIMAPGDADDVAPMLDWALNHDGPTAIRYPKTSAESIEHSVAPIELGRAEVLRWGEDGMLIACGSMLVACHQAAERLAAEGLDFGVINARFVKPLDTATICRAVAECPLVVTVEEGMLMGGFGSAVLEAASNARLDTRRIRRLGLPDRFIEHGGRNELLADLGLDAAGIARMCRQYVGEYRKAATVNRAVV